MSHEVSLEIVGEARNTIAELWRKHKRISVDKDMSSPKEEDSNEKIAS